MKLFIDHTTLHCLSPVEKDRPVQDRLRNLLQFVEELVLADSLWLADTEGKKTIAMSREVEAKLQPLNGDAGGPLVSITRHTDEDFREACSWAAEALTQRLLSDPAPKVYEDLRKRGKDEVGETRPSGVQVRDFPGLIMIVPTWNSGERDAKIKEAMAEREFLSTASLFLLNGQLYEWLRQCAQANPVKEDTLYNHLNTLCRWHINQELSEGLTKRGQAAYGNLKRYHYAPAYARAATIGRSYLRGDSYQTLHRLHQQMDAILQDAKKIKFGERISIASEPAALPVPFVGAWTVLSLSQQCTMNDLVQRIAELRNEPEFIKFRRWIAGEASDFDMLMVFDALRRNCKIPPATKRSLELLWTPLGPKLRAKEDLTEIYGHATPWELFRSRILTGSKITVLTLMMEKFLNTSYHQEIYLRIESLMKNRN